MVTLVGTTKQAETPHFPQKQPEALMGSILPKIIKEGGDIARNVTQNYSHSSHSTFFLESRRWETKEEREDGCKLEAMLLSGNTGFAFNAGSWGHNPFWHQAHL